MAAKAPTKSEIIKSISDTTQLTRKQVSSVCDALAVPNFNAEAEGVTFEQIIQEILTLVPRGASDRLL